MLPEKWCIKQNISQEVCDWFNTKYYAISAELTGDAKYIVYPSYSNCHFFNSIPKKYVEIDFKTFKKYILDKKVEQKLTRGQLIQAYNEFTCEDWKKEIKEILKDHLLSPDDTRIIIPEEAINKITVSGTELQKEYVGKLGIVLQKDKNAFIKEAELDYLYKVSEELFGNKFIFQIGFGAVPYDKRHLKRKCFHVNSKYKVNLIEDKGTIIEIVKNE